MSYGLTSRQADLLRFILGYQRAHGGVSPSMLECAAALGSDSKSTVHGLLVSLERRGAIRRLPGRARAIHVISRLAVPSIDGAPLYAVPLVAGQGRTVFAAPNQDRCHAA
jgi:SOS-response transcriptional repressor LexA